MLPAYLFPLLYPLERIQFPFVKPNQKNGQNIEMAKKKEPES